MSSKDLSILHAETTIPFHPVLAEMFDISGALLLQQIHYWCEVKPNHYGGFKWHWNSYENWATQLRVLSVTTIRRKLKELVYQGVVITGTFNKAGYDRTLWYRLDYEKLALKLGSFTGAMWSKRTHGSVQIEHIQLINLDGPIPKTIPKTNHETTGELSLAEDQDMNVHDVLAKAAAKVEEKKKIEPGKTKVGDLVLLWQKKRGASGEFQKPMTLKEKGMLGHSLKGLGDAAYPTLEWALDNWLKFIERVATQEGKGKGPSKPQVDFFAKNYHVAAQLIAASVAPGHQSETTHCHSHVIHSSSSPTQIMQNIDDTAHTPATMDDLQEALASIEAIHKVKGKQ
jgi:hypothetical protein